MFQGHTLLSRVDGADAARLAKEVDSVALKGKGGEAKTDRAPVPASGFVQEETEEQLKQRLLQLMNQSHVVLFMKGSPDVPRCGFSRTIVGLLRDRNVEFTHFDILSDESVRSGAYSDLLDASLSITLQLNFGSLIQSNTFIKHRSEGTKQLANIPAAYCWRRIRGWIRHSEGDDRKRRI